MGKESKKKLGNMIFFFLVMGLSFYAVFHGQDLQKIGESMRHLPVLCIGGAVLNALFFVSAEGCMIYYLLRSMDGKGKFWRCISYSFIGFFYSGITPSATGGQPMQIYYMKKEKISIPVATVILMVVTITYKLVLVVIGVGIFVFGRGFRERYLGEVLPVFYLGVALALVVTPDNFLVFVYIINVFQAAKAAGMQVCAVYDRYSAYQDAEKKQLADYYTHEFTELIEEGVLAGALC